MIELTLNNASEQRIGLIFYACGCIHTWKPNPLARAYLTMAIRWVCLVPFSSTVTSSSELSVFNHFRMSAIPALDNSVLLSKR